MITKSELIEYLKHTPENTNYNILYSSLYNGSNKEAVDEFIEVLSRGNLSLAALQPYLAKLYEDDKTISPDPLPPFSSGGASVPKPLTYDYMPEGYPSKTMETVTLMKEQEVEFALMGDAGQYAAVLPSPLEIVEGQTYTVNWDGTEYECTCSVFYSDPVLGNTSIIGEGDDTGEPFLYIDGDFVTIETSATHTISVKGIEQIVTPMTEKFIPKPLTYDHMPEGYPSKSRFTIEWDGNTEGLTAQESMYKVSDLVVDPSVFASGATLTYASGRTDFMSIDAATGKNLITIEPGKITFGEGQVKIFTETPESPFEIGVYFQSNEIYDVRKVTGGEVITPMAEEFLPSEVTAAIENAQTTADNAQAAANAAQSTADHKLDKNNPHGTGCFSLNTEYSTAVQDGSVAFGSQSRATGTFSFAHGGEISQIGGNEATGAYSHAEGRATRAIGVSAHAEGERTFAYGISSHAEGRGTIVHGNFCHVEGRFNKLDQSGQYAHVVGNGTENHLANAYTLDWSGNGWFAGNVEARSIILMSSTADSTKKFKITVDDSGAISATEVTT